jgi:hypothetical protein
LVALPSADAELTLGQLVIERQLAPAETLARAALVQSETGEPLDAVLTRLGLVSERALAEATAASRSPSSIRSRPSRARRLDSPSAGP